MGEISLAPPTALGKMLIFSNSPVFNVWIKDLYFEMVKIYSKSMASFGHQMDKIFEQVNCAY